VRDEFAGDLRRLNHPLIGGEYGIPPQELPLLRE
jgi:hypothetical protein